MIKSKLVVLSGAGMSAESGIPTFRGSDGLWEGHRIEDVATPQAWEADFRSVLEFYNYRREAVLNAEPNEGHSKLAELQEWLDVEIITQNIDDLHERAGSNHVMHLHGEIRKARSTQKDDLIVDIAGPDLNEGDLCPLGSQLRPHVVWFGEPVPMMEKAIEKVLTADIFLVVGTSLQVYPAASLLNFIQPGVPIYSIDPNLENVSGIPPENVIRKGAVEGMKLFEERLISPLN